MEWLAEHYGLVIFVGIIVGFWLFGGLGSKKKPLQGWKDKE